MQPTYCDNHLFVACKPSGVTTEDFCEQAKSHIKRAFKKPGNVFLEPIHRLDKPVSGLVIFARTSKALSRLQEAMRRREINKTYHAEVEGALAEDEGRLEHFLRHGSFRAHVVAATHPDAKKAVLHYKVLERKKQTTLVEIELETGRYHQIRAQFAAIGHPIVGDEKYGAKERRESIALSAVKLAFKHPARAIFCNLHAVEGSSFEELVSCDPQL